MLFALAALAFLSPAKGFGKHYSDNEVRPVARFDLEVIDKYKRYRTECGLGEYLNLCAECVSGHTEKEDGFGADSCGVCAGLETCRDQCFDPMADLDDDPLPQQGCTRLISMSPGVLDLAESREGSLCILGDGVSPGQLPGLECALRKADTDIAKFSGKVLEDKVQLSFPIPSEVGDYDLVCNSSIGVDFKESLQVVDSAGLQPMTVDKAALVTWTEHEVKLTAAQVAGPMALICFGREASGQLIYAEWSSDVQGNQLSSTVVCPGVVLTRPGQVEFGIAYSKAGIKSARALKVTGVALSPKPLSAVYLPEKSTVKITFDQNLQEQILSDCAKVFPATSLLVFGKGPVCEGLANTIQVRVKDASSLGSTVLQFTDNVRTMFSEVAVDGSVPLDVGHSQVRAQLEVRGGEKVCPGDSPELQLNAQTGDWQVKVVPGNLSAIPIGQRQRLNMLMWRANRSSRAGPKTFRINSTSLSAGMKYQVEAVQAGGGGASLEVTVARQGEVWASLEGPSEVDLPSPALYQARIKACGPSPPPTKFEWEVVSSGGEKLDTSLQEGPRLRLDDTLLLPDQEYTVAVSVLAGDAVLGRDEMKMTTSLKRFALDLAESLVVIGTGQPLEVDASRSVSLDEKLVKFKWTCLRGYCFLPGKDKTPLSSLPALRLPALRLPAKSLAIGRYTFEVEAVTTGRKADAEVDVSVVPGQPPSFSRLAVSYGGPGKEPAVSLHVSEVRGPCHFYWESVPAVGYSYFPVPEGGQSLEGSPNSPVSGALRLELAGARPGASYRLRAVADCGRFAQSQLRFQFTLPDSFPPLQLQVEPAKGKALETLFTYSVHSDDSSDYSNYFFNFGYEQDGLTKVLSSSHSSHFTTLLGHGRYQPLVEVCRSRGDCTTLYGPEVTTAPASGPTEEVLSLLLKEYTDLLLSTSFSEANALLGMVVPAIKDKDLKKFETFSSDIQKVIEDRIQVYTKRLEVDKTCLEDSVRLLDAATNAMTLLVNNDQLVTELLAFRDHIHQATRDMSEKKMETKISANLGAEHRTISKAVRPKRKTTIQGKEMSETTVNTFLKLASSLLNMTNDTEKIRQEKVKLLTNIPLYASQFCNELDGTPTKEAGSGSDIAMIGSKKYKGDEKLKKIQFPVCTKVPCPNATGLVSVSPANGTKDSKGSEGSCLATAYLRDDILMDTSLREPALRVSEVYWLDVLPYRSGAVEDRPKQGGDISPGLGEPVDRGNVTMQLPLRRGPRPEGTVLRCVRYENKTWNMNSCRMGKEIPNSFLFCVCPYPGYFSVFAVSPNGTSPPSTNNVTAVTAATPSVTVTVTNVTAITSATTPVVTATAAHATTSTAATPPVAVTVTNVTAITTTTTPVVTATAAHATTSTAATPPVAVTAITAATPPAAVTVTAPPVAVTVPSVTAVTATPPPPAVTTITARRTHSTPAGTGPSSPATSSGHLPTSGPGSANVTPWTEPIHDYKYLAYFRINESYSEKVGEKEKDFSTSLRHQLVSSVNLSLPTSVEAEEGRIKVVLKMEERRLSEETNRLALLHGRLKNGSLQLQGLDGRPLSVPGQDLHLMESIILGKRVSSATTALVSMVVGLLLLLFGSLVAAVYLRATREQRSLRLAQDLYEEPPAPKYLRLHDSVTLDSSGPSSPSLTNEMESSLAVMTRPRARGYESVDQFSNLPGNI